MPAGGVGETKKGNNRGMRENALGCFCSHLSPEPPSLVVKSVGRHARREDARCLLADAGIP